jgi:phenylalanyl-tRNA synthetase beta chain
MKTSLKWLKDYLDITLTANKVAESLTMAGLEVKNTQVIGANWDNVVVGQIKAINPHPNADRLRIPTIDLGTEEVNVVCGAPNLCIGDKIAFARVGAELFDGHTGAKAVLKEAKIRGVSSSGMVCSEKELGISDNHTGILVLPADAPVGSPLAGYMSDAMFNLEITPNRPDCLSVIGIVRELSVLTGKTVRLPVDTYREVDPPIEQQISVEIEAPDLCPRYSATLIKGIHIAESPVWMKERLIAGGMRPINNIVDITNFVMLEYGQPLHSFDYDRIQGRKIIVRRAKSGEKMQTLDGTDRVLTSQTLVIADTDRAVAVAGVMGGANTEVTENTTSIFLESANFSPTSIHYTGRTLGTSSEACVRFERGIRPDLTMPALKRATQLMQELGGGEVARGIIDVYPGKKSPQIINLSTVQVKRVLGIDISRDRISQILTALGFECRPGSGANELTVTPPYWRSDIRLTEDLVEEVARIDGYDKIPVTLLAQPIPPQNPLSSLTVKREVRNILVGFGFEEIMTPSLIGIEALNKLSPEGTHMEALRLSNPMTAEQEYLRPTLRANLLSILALNQKVVEGNIRLVETSKVFIPRTNDLPDERDMVCGVIGSSGTTKWWHGEDINPDFFTAKGIVESLLNSLNVKADFVTGNDPTLHTAMQTDVMAGDKKLGVVGEIHPRIREKFEIPGPAYLFELDLPLLVPLAVIRKMYKPLPRFPSVVRDLALVLDAKISHKQALDIIRGFPLVDSVALFDIYSGEQVPAGKKSLAYRITFQSPNKTLTDDAVSAIMKQILIKLDKELGATLR